MRDPEIYDAPKCAIAPRCRAGWELWCRGCNGVFCKTHIDRAIHACPSRDKMSQAPKGFTSSGAQPVERGYAPGSAKPSEAKPANRTVHRNGLNGKVKR